MNKNKRSFDRISHASPFGGLGQNHNNHGVGGKKHNKHMYGLAAGAAAIGRATGFKKRSFQDAAAMPKVSGVCCVSFSCVFQQMAKARRNITQFSMH